MDNLEKQLTDAMWIGGQQPSAADREAFEGLAGAVPDVEQFPHTFAWFALVSKFTPAVRGSWAGAAPAGGKGGKKDAKKETKAEEKTEVKEEKKAEAAADDDDFDPFAEEDEEEKAQMERMKAKAAASGKVIKHVVAKSLILWEIKPWEAETNLDELAEKILAEVKMDGLEWKTEYKKEPVAFGVFKLVMGCVVEDEKVPTDDVSDAICAFEDYVQSVDIAGFNKL